MTNEPSWKTTERVVAALERVIYPTALIEHDVHLPVLGSARSRQCDVVITLGVPPRQTRTIVEVQDRSRKPELVTFHGWFEKMREVGAQQLLCVSEIGYPSSIIEEVTNKYGPTVQLLTLKELEELQIGKMIFPFNSIIHTASNFTFISVGPIRQVGASEQRKVTSLELNVANDRIFKIGETSEPKSLAKLTSEILDELLDPRLPLTAKEAEISFTLGTEEIPPIVLFEGREIILDPIPVAGRIKYQSYEIPLSIREYKQEGIDEALAWIIVAEGEVQGAPYTVKFVFRRNNDGRLDLFSVEPSIATHFGVIASTSEEGLRAVRASLF